MEPQNQNINLSQPQMQNQFQNQNKSSIGGIIGTIIIIAIIILGGLYFWGKRIEENKLQQTLLNESNSSPIETPEAKDEAAVIKSVSSSDDLQSIQSDLYNTKLDDLDAEINPKAE